MTSPSPTTARTGRPCATSTCASRRPSWCCVAGRTGSGQVHACCAPSTAWSRTSPAGASTRRRPGRRAEPIRGTAPRELARPGRLRRPGPARRLRHRRRWRRSSPTAWSSSASTPQTMRRRVEETLDLLGIADLRGRPLRSPVRRPAAARRDRRGADHAPARPGAGRAHLGARPDRGRGRARHARPAGGRPRAHRAARRAPHGAGGPVRGPAARGRGRRVRSGPDRRDARATRRWRRRVVELGRLAGWQPLPLSVREARRRTSALRERLADPPVRPVRTPDGPAVLEARGVVVRYGRTVAVAGRVPVRARAGEVVALMGRNGSGKSSLLWALQGAGRRDGGAVASTAVTRPPLPAERGAAAGRAGAADRRPTCSTSRPSRDECARRRPPGRGARRAPAGPCSTGSRPASTATGTPGTCPRGSGSRSCSRSCSPRGPRSLALDEPTRGLDYAAKRRWRRSLAELAAEGRGVLVATHDVEFVAQVADRSSCWPGERSSPTGPTRPGARRVAGVRPPDVQGARRRLAHRRPGPGGDRMTARMTGARVEPCCAVGPPLRPRARAGDASPG